MMRLTSVLLLSLHLLPAAAVAGGVWISNHTDFPGRKVVMDLVGKTNFTYDAKGASLTVREPAIALHLKDCRNVTIRNLAIDWERPVLTEAHVVEFKDGETRIRIDTSRYPVAVEEGRLLVIGPGRRERIRAVRFLNGRTGEPVALTADTSFRETRAREESDGTIVLATDYSREGTGLMAGDILVFRPFERPYPSVFIEDSSGVLFEDVIIRDAYGMGVIAQMSENITWRGTGRAEDRTSGVIAREGSHVTTHADASHFSNCRGQVTVENCWFEGMMDDAINVHSTCVQITNMLSRSSVRCVFRHPEAIGFTLFRPGDRARLIRSRTNEDGPVLAVVGVRRIADDMVELDFGTDMPADFGVGDTVENADFQCAATFRGNVVKNNRARGVLFTTPGKVICSSNRFERCCGSAVVLASDAAYWFESGHCRDVEIAGNVISNCLTAGYGRHGSAFGVISIDPIVRELDAQKDYCHGNVRIVDNEIFTFDATLLFARSTKDILWRNNVVRYNNDFRGWDKPPFVFEHSAGFKAEPAKTGDVPEYEVWIPSSKDGSLQPFRFHVPERAKGRKSPLLVALHTWSYDQRSDWPWGWAKGECEKRGWVLVYPKFRGPNWKPEACGSDLAVQDVLDAIDYAKGHADIDDDRVYLTGGSGGGHMSLLLAGRVPEMWAGVYSACPITDIARWHADSVRLKRGYANHLVSACGGTPAENPEEFRHRSPLTYLARAKERGVHVQVATGIHDGHYPGSVPVGHAIRAFNALAEASDVVSEEDIAFMERNERVPDALRFTGRDPFFGEKTPIYLRRTSANVRLTVFEGGHAGNFDAGIDWLARQRRGASVDWTLPSEAVGTVDKVTK